MAQGQTTSHFWLSSFPYFSSSLILSSGIEAARDDHKLEFFDPDGELINEVVSNFGSESCTLVELDSFLDSCKLEAGLKHSHLKVTSPAGYRHLLRFHGKESACLSSPAQVVSGAQGGFFPLVLAKERSFLIGVINESDVDGTLRIRLFCGSRAPETTCVVPARGARVISIPAEFPTYIPEAPGKTSQAYVRIGTTSEARFGVQLVERNDALGDRETYSSVS